MNAKYLFSVLIPVAIVATTLSACSASISTTTINQGKAEDLVVKAFSGGQVEPKSATCPDGIKAEKGGTFECDIVYEDGTMGVVTVDMTSDDGDVTIKPGAQTITTKP